MLIAIRASELGRSSELPVQFVEGGVTFIVDRAMPVVPGYEWVDNHTVRIHPDAVGAMFEFQERV